MRHYSIPRFKGVLPTKPPFTASVPKYCKLSGGHIINKIKLIRNESKTTFEMPLSFVNFGQGKKYYFNNTYLY
jgi:hypothetical protein